MKTLRWRAVRKALIRDKQRIDFEFICIMRAKDKKRKPLQGKELAEAAIKSLDKYMKLLGIEDD